MKKKRDNLFIFSALMGMAAMNERLDTPKTIAPPPNSEKGMYFFEADGTIVSQEERHVFSCHAKNERWARAKFGVWKNSTDHLKIS